MTYTAACKKILSTIIMIIVMMSVSAPFLEAGSHHAHDVEHSFMKPHVGESSHTHHDHPAIELTVNAAFGTAQLRLPVHDLYKLAAPQNYYAKIERPPESLSLP